MTKAFTMIELIFVIVILGILAGVAIPRLSGTRDDAEFVKAKTIVASVRSGIAIKHNTNIMSGTAGYPANLEEGCTSGLFCGVIDQGVKSASAGNNGWSQSSNTYTIKIGSTTTNFTYYPSKNGDHKAGEFSCKSGEGDCDRFNK